MANIISEKRAQNLVWNFHHERSNAHSISVTFPISDLEAFREAYRNEEADELRIYFGQYGNNIKNVEHRQKHT